MRNKAQIPLYHVFTLVIVFILIGVTGYHILEDLNWFDSLYMTAVILSTVGFGGGINEMSEMGRVFTMLLIVSGGGIVAYAITIISEYIIENRLLRSKRMEKKVKKMKRHYIVCGYGRMGSIICRELFMKNLKFVVIESDPDRIEDARSEGFLIVQGDSLDDSILKKANLKSAKGLVAVLSSDENNLFVTLSARGLNKDLYIIAKNKNALNKSKFLTAGANKVLNPYEVTGHSFANMLTRPAVVDFLEILGQGSEVGWEIDEIRVCQNSELDGTPLAKTFDRSNTNVIIAAIKRLDGEMIFNPRGDQPIHNGDLLIAMGYLKNLRILENLCGNENQ